MSNQISNITVVGGGTAGWMSALYLATRFGRRGGRPGMRVALVESPNLPTVGVGEATVPAMRKWLHELEVDEAEFLRRCNASFKLGVRFVNWDTDPDGRPCDYVHPFHGLDSEIGGVKAGYYFNAFGSDGGRADGTDNLSPSTALIEALRAPRGVEPGPYESGVRYAYHLDAALFAEMLKGVALSRGVEHIQDDVDEVEVSESGFVGALHLRQGGRYPVELVIDCTGFRGRIIQGALDEPFESFGRYMLCDRALAVQIPHRDPTRLEPCTHATALGAGWAWRVPLYSRVGTGYVFSTAFRSDEEATEEFLAHLGAQAKDAQPRAIAMRVGRTRRSWVGNCVAVGLSGGFVEPLESTAIYIIHKSLKWLGAYFPDKTFEPALAKRYNALVERLYAEIRDFIILHYHASNRTDSPFWDAARSGLEVPDSLRKNLDLWHHALPDPDDFERTFLFNYWSYMIVLFGKRFFNGIRFPIEASLSEADWRAFSTRLTGLKARLTESLPRHHDVLTRIRAQVEGNEAHLSALAAGRRHATQRPTVPLPAEELQPQIRLRPGTLCEGHLL